jgi:ATP-binding cassette subfamily F protein 3
MTLIAGENISKQFEDRVIFKDLCFSANDRDRIGLIGPNGVGKTTLFEIMTERLTPDSGGIVKAKNCLISYMKQEFSGDGSISLFNYILSAREDLLQLEADIKKAESDVERAGGSTKAVERLGELQHLYEASGGYEFANEAKRILRGLGFPENRFHNPIALFSGGEKNRAALARALASKSNLLLLDEPTNHLDIDSTIWLEEYLKSQAKAYIIVSHDRTFLANTIDKVWEISNKKIEQYFNGLEKYLIERENRRIHLERQYKRQQEEIKRIEDFIRRNIAGQKTRQAQSKMKYLSRIKRIEPPRSDQTGLSLELDSGDRSFNLVLSMEKATFGYGHRAIVRDVDFNLYRGERVGLIGKNGSGKTTILKTILGELEPIDGSVRIGQKADVAYFDQELSDLNEENTVLDEIWQVDPLAEAGRIRTFLARFGFRGEDPLKKVAVLSGGEKTKLELAKLLFFPANFIIFDEPTNHLDIDSRQALEEALAGYNGASLIVSHDRYFLDRTVNKIIAIEEGTIKVYLGNYSYYREKTQDSVERAPKKGTDPDRIKEYADFKKLSQFKGRIKKELRSATSKIQDCEAALKKIEKEIDFNIPKTDWEKLTEAYSEKSRLEEMILELYERLEELKRLDAEYSDIERQPD